MKNIEIALGIVVTAFIIKYLLGSSNWIPAIGMMIAAGFLTSSLSSLGERDREPIDESEDAN